MKNKRFSSTIGAFEYLKELISQNLSDIQIQDKLQDRFGVKWSRNTIFKNKKKIEDLNTTTNSDPDIADYGFTFKRPPTSITENEKAEWFRSQFKKSHLYKALKSQFDIDEIEVYIQEYGIICCQFEDLVVSEFFQIDDFLKHRILINRELVNVKNIKKEIEELQDWISNNPGHKIETEESKILRVQKSRLLDTKYVVMSRLSERYDRLVSEREKIHKALAATRRDRLDELKDTTTNFFDLVLQLQNNDVAREKHGKYAELTKIASEDMSQEFRKQVVFPDGTKDSIILDSDTDIIEGDDVE